MVRKKIRAGKSGGLSKGGATSSPAETPEDARGNGAHPSFLSSWISKPRLIALATVTALAIGGLVFVFLAEGEFALADGNRKIYGREGGANVGGHVIVTFGSMNKKGIAIRHEPRKETFQVTANIGIGIFLNEQGYGSVAKMQCQEAIFKTVSLVLKKPEFDEEEDND